MKTSLLASAAFAACLFAGGAQAQNATYNRPGPLGGGLIETLMARDPAGGQMQVPASSIYSPSARAATQRAAPAAQGPRYAAIPNYPDEEDTALRRELDSRFQRQMVSYQGAYQPGTIVINTSERMLYLIQGDGRAMRYGVGVGRPGFSWRGVKHIERKAEWPDWRPPSQMLKRRPDLPRFMAGGPNNPLGARAMYLSGSLFRIHGTNEPHTIGQAVSSGCIRMMNEDVTDLYSRVRVGTRVVVL